MNILYTESSPNVGGQELQAIAQMLAFQRAGHRVMLACRQNSRIAGKRKNMRSLSGMCRSATACICPRSSRWGG